MLFTRPPRQSRASFGINQHLRNPVWTSEDLIATTPTLGRRLMWIMSHSMGAEAELLTQLARNTAEQRLAAFLCSLALRLRERGLPDRNSATLSRHDMGSHLGLALETVSRLFSRFQQQGLISSGAGSNQTTGHATGTGGPEPGVRLDHRRRSKPSRRPDSLISRSQFAGFLGGLRQFGRRKTLALSLSGWCLSINRRYARRFDPGWRRSINPAPGTPHSVN